MSTEFLYREKDGGACGWEAYSLFTPGSFGGGPWTLRPKRLQWLNHTITTGFKIAAFPKCGGQSFRARRAFRPFFTTLRILIGAKPGRNIPSILFQYRKAVPV